MQRTIELRNPSLAAWLAWLIPGMGHFYQGRTRKGVLFSVGIIGLFVFGMYLGHGKVVYVRMDDQVWRVHYLAQVGVGAMALPALVYKPQWREGLPAGLAAFELAPSDDELDDLHRKYSKRMDIAELYTMIAGLLNLLVIYDAFAGPSLHDEEQEYLASRDAPGGGSGKG